MIAPSRPDPCGFGQSYNVDQAWANRGWRVLPDPFAGAVIACALLVMPGFGQSAGFPLGALGANAAGSGYSQQAVGSRWSDPEPGSDQPAFDYALPHPDAPRAGAGPTSPPWYPPVPHQGADTPRHGDRRRPGPAGPHIAPQGAGDRPAAPGPWTGQGLQGYRFRGDDVPNDGLWQELPDAPGFRFRPLTPDELERSVGTDGWRPLGRDDRRPTAPVAPGAADPYGYRTDSWFGKYYGERQ